MRRNHISQPAGKEASFCYNGLELMTTLKRQKKKKKKKKEVKTIKERTLNGPRQTEVDRLDQMNQSNGCF